MIQCKVIQAVEIDGRRIEGSVTKEAGLLVSINELVPPSATITINQPFRVDALKVLYFRPIGHLSVTFNGPGVNVFLYDGTPFSWYAGSDVPNPLKIGELDVTSIDVTNDENAAATLQMEILLDATEE